LSKYSFVLSQKRQLFRKNFRRKYLKNHNIGPMVAAGPASHSFFKVFPPQWGGLISFFTLQLQLLIAILQLPMSLVVFFLA
jgi:hypothetical protein